MTALLGLPFPFLVWLLPMSAHADEIKVLAPVPSSHRINGAPVFARTGDRVAYCAKAGGKGFAVVNGEAGPECGVTDSVVFSHDGKHVAYRVHERVNRREDWWIVVDGKRQETYSWVGPPALAPNSAKAAYWASKTDGEPDVNQAGGEYFMVFGKKPGPTFSGHGIRRLEPPVISPDGKKVAYAAAKRPGICYAVVGSKTVGNGHAGVETPGFSRDGKRFAYGAAVHGRRWAVVDSRGKAAKDTYDHAGSPVFGKGTRYAFVAKEGRSEFVVMGKKRYEGDYSFISHLTVSPDGKRVAFAALRGAHIARGAGGGVPSGGLTLKGGVSVLVVDGETLGEYEHVGPPVFGPRSKRVAYPAQGSDFKWRLICGDKKSDSYHHVSRPVFAPDGKSVGFGARKENELVWVTMRL